MYFWQQKGCLNISTNASWEASYPTFSPSALHITCFVLNSVLVIFGNVINSFILAKMKGLHKTNRFLLIGLSQVDFFLGLMIIVFSAPSAIVGRWLFGDILCIITGFLYGITFAVSLLFLTLICIDRYIAITRPLHYHMIVTVKRILVCVSGSLILMFASLFMCATITHPFDNIRYLPEISSCMVDLIHPCIATLTVIIFSSFLFQPFVILTSMYCRILYIANRSAKEMANNSSRRQRSFNRQATKTTLVITGAFAISWSPYVVSKVYSAATQIILDPELTFFAAFLASMNSWWNFIIYSVMNRQFRQTLANCLSKSSLV